MKKLILAFFLLFSLCIESESVRAQELIPPYLIYLPGILNIEYDDSLPWVGPPGGPVVSMVSDPVNANVLYAGSWGAGVFKSVDGGQTWLPRNTGLNNFYINSMAIDPYNSKIVYAGTYKDKLYKTTNGGDSWFQSSTGIQEGAIVYTITVDPQNADILFIGTRGENSTSQPPWKGIVYRSTNEGISWTPVLQNVSRLGEDIQDWAYDLVVNPKDHSIVFAGMHEAGVYKSTDGGLHWSASNSGINTDTISVRGLSINPPTTSTNALYMGTWHREGTYKSTNNAVSWTQSPLDVKIYDMDLDKTTPSILYLANFDTYNFKGGIYKTNNGTSSWSLVGLGNESIYAVMVNQNQHTQIFAGTLTDGVYRSNDSGASWQSKSQGLFVTNVQGIVTIQGEADLLLAATRSNGVSLSQDRGLLWQPLNSGIGSETMMGLIADPADNHILYALTINAGLYRCTLPTCSWTPVNSGVPTASSLDLTVTDAVLDEDQSLELQLAGIEAETNIDSKATMYTQLNHIVFANSNSNIVYLATEGKGVLRSINHATSWSTAGLSGKNVKSVAISPLDYNILYAATNESGRIYFSDNGGAGWQTQSLAIGACNGLSISPVNPAQVYAATDIGVYTKVTDSGWQLLGLAGHDVKAIAAHPTRPGILVAGTTNGYYYSMNNGLTWISGSTDMINHQVRTIHFDSNNPLKVYLGTTASGSYRFYLPWN